MMKEGWPFIVHAAAAAGRDVDLSADRAVAAAVDGLRRQVSAADVVCVASWNADLVSRVARPIARGETLMASRFEISPGGKGSNAAVAAARQGARVALIARVGGDDFGRMGLDLWRAEGIATDHVEVAPGETSGVAQIRVYDDGDNSIAVFPGECGSRGAPRAAARATLKACRVVMASCEVPLPATMEAFRIARAGGAATVLNPAPAQPLPEELLRLVDVLAPNESEVAVLAALAGARRSRRARRHCSSAGRRRCWSRWAPPAASSTGRESLPTASPGGG